MSRLGSAKKAVGKLQGELNKVEDRIAAAAAAIQVGEERLPHLRVVAYGDGEDDPAGVAELEAQKADILKHQERYEGLTGKAVELKEALNAAKEVFRREDTAVKTARIFGRINKIEPLQAQIDSLLAANAADIASMADWESVESAERQAEAEEFANVTERFKGGTFTRTITDE
ncbi:MAG: hypothetical protein ABSC13_06440 [Dehalococcoidia bacterium]|jgi:hypothetical protein